MHAAATTDAPQDTGADTIAIGVFEGERIAHDVQDGALQALVDAGEARKLAVAHAAGHRYVLVNLGERDAFGPEPARVAAATVVGRAKELGTATLCWELPHHVDDAVAAALVEGTLLAAYAFTAYKAKPPEGRRLERLVVSAHHDVSAPVEHARVAEEAVNRAAIEAAGMGAFAAVARGSLEEPRLITLRYAPADPAGPVLGLVGKAVTFDSGGLSIKPRTKMAEMKFDMSGGAVVLEAVGAIAELGLPVPVVAVIGAAENLPSDRAFKPGDIVRAKDGTTIEIIDTDAEGRLVLADCLLHAREQGAERLVDVATLTGAIISALGSTHAGLFGADDPWCEALAAAGRASGELLWRLPLHEEYAKSLEGPYSDVVNVVENRRAASIVAAEFLRRFTGDVPWAHLDICGTAWNTGRPYAGQGGSAFGVRLLVELATMAPWTSTSPTTTS